MAFDIQFKLIYQGIRDVFRVRSLSQLLDKVGEYVDQKIENLPVEEQEAAEMRLMETADALVDTIDKAYTVTEKACDSIIDSLDELEKWIDKW